MIDPASSARIIDLEEFDFSSAATLPLCYGMAHSWCRDACFWLNPLV